MMSSQTSLRLFSEDSFNAQSTTIQITNGIVTRKMAKIMRKSGPARLVMLATVLCRGLIDALLNQGAKNRRTAKLCDQPGGVKLSKLWRLVWPTGSQERQVRRSFHRLS